MAYSVSRSRGNVLPDRGGICDFHDFRSRLRFLHRQELKWSDAPRDTARPDFEYDLFAFEQPDDSLGDGGTAQRKDCRLQRLLVHYVRARRDFYRGNSAGMASP